MFEMEVGSDRLVASLGPPDMSKKMSKQLFDYPTDLLSLPGSWSTTVGLDGSYSEDQFVSQMQALTCSSTGGSSLREHDPNWKSAAHHALGKVTNLSSLTDLINGYQRTLSRAQKFEKLRLKEWMGRYDYRSRDITSYERTGGLPLVLREIGRLYFSLLMKLQSEAQAVAPNWSGTYAEGMLKHHSKELAYIRAMSGSRSDLFLTNYTYLRDAAKSKWTNQEISDMLIKEQVARISGAGGDEGGGGATMRKACRCQGNKLHRLLGLNYYDTAANTCPLASATTPQTARKAAKILLAKVEGQDSTPSRPTWVGWAAKAVEAAQAGRDSIP